MRDSHESVHSKDRKKEETTINKDKLATSGVARSLGVYTTQGGGAAPKIHLPGGPHLFLFHKLEVEHNLPLGQQIKKREGRNKQGLGEDDFLE